MMLPPEQRYRTSTHHLAPFWAAHGHYRHDPDDAEIRAREWDGLGLDPATATLLLRAGLTCYRVVPPCPDWLLRSIPGIGPVHLAEIRRILPYARDIYAGPDCPGRAIEAARATRARLLVAGARVGTA
jgi:hypothetical protein